MTIATVCRVHLPGPTALATLMPACALLLTFGPGLLAGSDLRLVEAAKRRDGAAIRLLLERGVDANAPQADGATALHWAAHWDDVETADLLIRSGARVDAANEIGATPLFLACENGNAAIVRLLLTDGANPNPALRSGETPLMTAARTGSAAIVEALLAGGADVNWHERTHAQTALMWATAQGHSDVVRLLLAHHADTNARSSVTRLLVNRADPFNNMARRTTPRTATLGQGGFTALLFAARVGHLAAARLLIEAGANVNDMAADGSSALLMAAYSGNHAVAAFLLDRGADPNLSKTGYTPLLAAVLRGDLNLLQSLLARHAALNERLLNGTPMTRYGQDYAMPDSLVGATPFLLAARLGEVEMMRVLASHGADPRLGTADGTTPLMQAAGLRVDVGGLRPQLAGGPPAEPGEAQAGEMVKLVGELGVDVNGVNDAGDTALHGAAAKGYTSVVRLLVGLGARVDVTNKRGQTPLSVAPSRRGGDSTAGTLRQLGATN